MLKITISASLVVYKPDFLALEHTVLNLHLAVLVAKNDYDVSFNLTVVDNSSDEAYYQRLKSWIEHISVNVPDLNLHLLRSPDNVGYGRGNNLVIEKSQSKYHLVINPDLYVEADAIRNALAFMESDVNVGLLSPSVFGEDGIRQYLCKRNPTLFIMFLRSFSPKWVRHTFRSVIEKFEMRDISYDEVIDGLQYPSGCFMFFRTKPLQQIQGFDSRYFLHYEDADIGRRMLKIARVAYVPSVKVVHKWARDTHTSWKMRMVTVKSGLLYWWIWGGIFKPTTAYNFNPQSLAPQIEFKSKVSKKILVTGATGFIGKSLCEELVLNGQDVCVAIRADVNPITNASMVKIGELNGRTDWSTALDKADVVIHLAARVHVLNDGANDSLTEFRKVNVDGTLNLAWQAAQAGVKRFIFISSVKVNGELTSMDRPFRETDIANPQDSYGISKLEAEQGLLQIAQQTGIEVVIIRPPLVYGAGVKANFASMMRAVKRGIPLPLGAISNKRSFVYVGNLVSLIIKCIDHPAAVNQVFLASDGYDISTTELLKECAKAQGVKVRLFPIPQMMIEVCAVLFGKRVVVQRLCGNLQVDINKANTLLGWVPQVSVAEGLKVTANSL
ncbi:GDP-6-deoxy-D-mannose reductase [mine drainage metagenome]|uniref:GDP-6-deoxy-D-mannose reductase n=1 Tax=mine drainage metagenome TaxID=410659 RepID=A0A1J5RMW0_9ZZZZ